MTERLVLTTGANSGIGLATAVEVAKRRFVSIGSVRSAEKAKVVHKAARAAGVEVETVLLDVTDAAQCEKVIADLDLFGLVNNAGYALTGAVEDVGDDEARALFETMVHAPMRLARLALPGMRAAGGGRIVNVSSIAGLATMPFAGHYTGAKHALEALSDALRVEVASDGVKVVLVEPGGFKTGIWEEFQRDVDRREAEGSRHGAAYRRSLQSQRLMEPMMGDPQLCARVIAGALASRSPRSRYLVGLDAQAILLAQRLTPTFVKDRVLRIGLGL
ncbi:MAG TPA: SDR family oxidoreductase [Acidimicrobiales bacterium]|nr:SDR family oxidoreductase [Acidimicrobiales bacterium]